MSTVNSLREVLEHIEIVIELAKQNPLASDYEQEIKDSQAFIKYMNKRLDVIYGKEKHEQA